MSKNLALRFEREAMPFRDLLYGYALRLTRRPHDAEDLVQDTLVKACAGYHRFRPGTNIRTWLRRVMITTYLNGYRKFRQETLLSSESIDALAAHLPFALPAPIPAQLRRRFLTRCPPRR